MAVFYYPHGTELFLTSNEVRIEHSGHITFLDIDSSYITRMQKNFKNVVPNNVVVASLKTGKKVLFQLRGTIVTNNKETEFSYYINSKFKSVKVRIYWDDR